MAESIRRKSGIKDLKKILKDLERYEVRVGVPDGVMHSGSDGKSVSMVQIAFWNEFGTSKIPERSFLRSSLREGKAIIAKSQKIYVDYVMGGHVSPKMGLEMLGLVCVNLMRQKIYDGLQPPLAQSTIRARYFGGGVIKNPNVLSSLAMKGSMRSKSRSAQDIKKQIAELKQSPISASIGAKFIGSMLGSGVFGIPLLHTGEFIDSFDYQIRTRS